MTTVIESQPSLQGMPVAEAGTVPPLALRPCWSTCGATWWPESRSCRCCGVEPAMLSSSYCCDCAAQIAADWDAAWAAMDEDAMCARFAITPEGREAVA